MTRQSSGKRRSKPFIHAPLAFKTLPEPVFYIVRSMPANTLYPPLKHDWGEFVFSFSGVLELEVEGKCEGQNATRSGAQSRTKSRAKGENKDKREEFRVPPSFGLWLPPGTRHQGRNQLASDHCSLYIDQGLAQSRGMPTTACALLVNPMLKAMLQHWRYQVPESPYSHEQTKLLDVMLDQLAVTPSAGSYLPNSTDALLAAVLAYFKSNPGCSRTLADVAAQFATTERTLARRAQRDLGMAISEWRARLKVMHAIPMLQQGHSVESIALDLGYSTASAFIAMFRRMLNTTPDEYRKKSH